MKKLSKKDQVNINTIIMILAQLSDVEEEAMMDMLRTNASVLMKKKIGG